MRAISVLVLVATLVSGCSMLPVNGPSHRDITTGATMHLALDRRTVAQDYALVDVDSFVLESLASVHSAPFARALNTQNSRPPAVKIGVGDILQIAVFESGSGGLFQPTDNVARPANFISFPQQVVDATGFISFPFAGRIRVAGRSPSEVERNIESKLADRAIEPQVVVTIAEQNASSVSVLGDTLNGSNTFKISGAGERILDIISKAGGTRYPGYELFVTVQRGDRRATVHFPTLVNDPKANIYVAPGDTIYVYRKQEKFVALGALGSTGQTQGLTGQFSFEQAELSLNEALAKAGGLQDLRANPSQVFLYRMEYRAALEHMGSDLSLFPHDQEMVPTVYRVNFRDPSSFFTADKFRMRDKDVLYAANADAIEVVKFLAFAQAVTSTVSGVSTDTALTRDIMIGRHVLGAD